MPSRRESCSAATTPLPVASTCTTSAGTATSTDSSNTSVWPYGSSTTAVCWSTWPTGPYMVTVALTAARVGFDNTSRALEPMAVEPPTSHWDACGGPQLSAAMPEMSPESTRSQLAATRESNHCPIPSSKV